MRSEFDIGRHIRRLQDSDEYFHTFIDRKSLAAGVLSLGPGEEDVQEPHDSDEIYYIVDGDGFLRIGKKDHAVSKGMAFFVAANTKHRFFGNTKRLDVIYFFGCPDQR